MSYLFLINISGFFIDSNQQTTEPVFIPGFEGAPSGYFYSVRPLSDLHKFLKDTPQNPDLAWLTTAIELYL